MFERYRLAFCAELDAPAGGGTPALDSAAIQKLIDDAVGKALAARLPRVKNTEETIAKMVADAIAKVPPQVAAPIETTIETPEKLNLKTLQEQVDKERRADRAAFDKLQQQLKDEREANTKLRIRSDVEQHFARHLGADSKHIKPYVNEYLGQFIHKDGQTYRKGDDGYGGETLSPVDKGIDEMFKSDLGHLIPARNGGLPPRNQPGQRGSAWSPPVDRAPQGMNPMDAEALEAISKSRPELAAGLAASFANRPLK